MKVLVASMRSLLLPLAHRLRREGHDVEALVWRPRYEAAWGGQIQKLVRHSDGTLNADALRPTVEAARRGEVAVVTDVRRVAEMFAGAPHLHAQMDLGLPQPVDRLLLGGWFTGEVIQAPHLLVADQGAWTGGGGPAVLGGLTLVRLGGVGIGAPEGLPGFMAGATQAATERLKSASFRGLFHFSATEDVGSGELRLGGLSAGWPWLHTQAFLAELKSLGKVLAGGAPHLLHKYVSVLPVTVPPWPSEKRTDMPAGVPVEGLTPEQQGRCFWFDIQVDTEARKLRTCGLDGLLAVTTGASDSTPALARIRALELAHRLQVPEKQLRADLGLQVDAVLAALEDRWSFVA